jgi:hypothetical protein
VDQIHVCYVGQKHDAIDPAEPVLNGDDEEFLRELRAIERDKGVTS